MSLSSIIGLIWVLLVSFTIRGWFPTHDLGWWTLVAGIAYVVVRLLEFFGVITFAVKRPTRRVKTV